MRTEDELRELNMRLPTLRRPFLRRVISTLREDWIREHLFGKSSINEATILSSPLQQLHSCAFSSEASLNNPNPEMAKFNMAVTSDMLFVPGYARDEMYACYGVQEQYGVFDESLDLVQQGRMTFRAIVSGRDGTLFGVQRLGNVDMLFYNEFSDRVLLGATFLFKDVNTEHLLTDASNDIRAVEKSLYLCMTSEAKGPCPSCGAKIHVPCSCPTDLRPAQHATDLSPITERLMAHISFINGVGLFEIFQDGIVVRSHPTGCADKLVNVASQGCAKRLFDWAIRNALLSSPVHIARPLAAALRLDMPVAEDCDDTLRDVFSEPLVQLDDVTHVSEVENIPLDSADKLAAPHGPPAFHPLISENVDGLESRHHVVEHDKFFPSASVPVDAFVPPSRIPLVASSKSTNRVILPRPTFVSPANRTMIPSANSHTLQSMARIAPRFVLTTASGMSAKTPQEVRAFRAYQRRLRNRESAARSNLKRRQRRLALASLKKQESLAADVTSE